MNRSPEKVNKIVVFVPNKKFFGANIVQIPFFQHLRRSFNNARITIWSPETAAGLIVKQGLADEMLIYRGASDYFRILKNIRNPKSDMVFSLRWFSDGINLLTGLSGARLRIGFATSSPITWLFNARVKRNDRTYMALLYLDLLKPTGIPIQFSHDDIKRIGHDSTLEIPEGRRLACMMPGGGEGEHKRWGIENYCRLGKLLIDKFPGLYLIFVLGPQENEYVMEIEKNFNKENYQILMSGSPSDIVKVSNNSDVVIANDCGPSHLAQLCGANYVGVWGWTNQHPQQRIINWTLPKPNSLHVVPDTGHDIQEILPEQVVSATSGFLPHL